MSFSGIKVPLSFVRGVQEISHLMKLYVNFLCHKKETGIPLMVSYNTHTLIRALETLFFHNFSCKTGVYVSARSGVIHVGGTGTNIAHGVQAHSWLTYKEDEKFIIDVVPVYGVLGLTAVTPVCLSGNRFGYFTSNDVDPRHLTPLEKEKLHDDINNLADLLQSFMVDVPLH